MSTTSVSASAPEFIVEDRVHGRVKWFNNKKGFGFIEIVNGADEYTGREVFIHFNNIYLQRSRYKTLYGGEYVSFHLVRAKEDKYELEASDVRGAFGGYLRVDSEAEEKAARNTHRNQNQSEDGEQRQTRPVRRTGGGRGGGRGRGRGRGGPNRGAGRGRGQRRQEPRVNVQRNVQTREVDEPQFEE
jgi:CspA family cold shock protein